MLDLGALFSNEGSEILNRLRFVRSRAIHILGASATRSPSKVFSE